MDFVSTWILRGHMFFGFASLILFWLPVVTRKGSLSHRKIGKLYVWFMWIVVVSAATLSLENLFTDNVNGALFLGFLSLITANPLWYGTAILKHKNSLSKTYKSIHFGFNIVIFISAIGLVTYGVYLGKGVGILMIIFGCLGIMTGFQIIREYRNGLDGLSWFQHHYKGMIISGIAAYTAFFAFGGNRFLQDFLTGYWQVVPWVLPTVLGTISMRRLDKYYMNKGVLQVKTS